MTYRLVLPFNIVEDFLVELQYISQTLIDNKVCIFMNSKVFLPSTSNYIDKWNGSLTPDESRLINITHDILITDLDINSIYFDFYFSLDNNIMQKSAYSIMDFLDNQITRLYKLRDYNNPNSYIESNIFYKYQFLVKTSEVIKFGKGKRIKIDYRNLRKDYGSVVGYYSL